ncbi:MAG: hypothetical protein K0R39_880 [Symbiobacteriaceae bacterium]|jgi:hypothetical protein|nr:hypothetical protein [Symbiobacteriaceae bacterium]
MSTARSNFLQRIKAFKVALDEPALISQAPTCIDHNNTARLLRNGLAVVGFALLEDFLKSRLNEVLSRVGNSHIPFDELPDALKEAAVVGALRALAYQGDMRKRQGDDYLSYIQEHSQFIASTSSAAYQVSGISLGWERPNLNDADVKEVLRVFKVKDGWGNIDRLASRVGLASPSLKDAFRQAALRRHKAAHSASADTEITHLKSFVPQALGVALAFDSLVSKSLHQLLIRDATFLSEPGETKDTDVTIRFLERDGTDWREIKERSARAVRRNTDLAQLTAECLARPDAQNDVVVVRDASRQPVDWYIQSVV